MTRWNRQGLRWREWTTPEILQVIHAENIEYLRNHKKNKLRPYLIHVGDEDSLRQVDLENMNSGRAAK